MVSLKITLIAVGVVGKTLAAGMWLFNVALAVQNALVGKKIMLDKLSIGQMILYRVVMLGAKLAMIAFAIASVAGSKAMLLFNMALMANPIGAIIGLIGLFIGAMALLVMNWDTVAAFFVEMWDGIKNTFIDGWTFVSNLIEKIKSPFSDLFAGVIKVKQAISSDDSDKDTQPEPGASPQLVSQAERVSTSLQERRDTVEVAITDESGKASIIKEPTFSSSKVSLKASGGF